ncbi:hypothetical protein DEV92_11962 [Phyllobacterium myrsinacearum]|nr:hypothetical protein DEV92_11962 [Phyllobacterium myrsinacearum]RZU96974.1 hypothetical protein EV654_4959 [Phyllobacterium myrsinacearum]
MVTQYLYLWLLALATKLGVNGENHWANANFDHDTIDAQTCGLGCAPSFIQLTPESAIGAP